MSNSCGTVAFFAGLWIMVAMPLFAGETICLEAESPATLTPPMRKISVDSTNAPEVKEASGGQCLEIPEGVGKPPEVGGDASYAFLVNETADFVLWVRAWWLDSCGNSLTVIVDNGKPFALGQDGTYKSWHWVRGMKVNLSAGSHEVKIENREDGVKIDQIIFSSTRQYVPVGVETASP